MAEAVGDGNSDAMDLNRLFRVLVLPAFAAGACDDEGVGDEAGMPAPGPGASSDDGDDAMTDGPAATTGSPAPATTTDEPAATTDDPDPPATGEGSGDGASSDTGADLECTGNANDPCGCLCCWVMDGCLNTEACCASWSDCAPEPE